MGGYGSTRWGWHTKKDTVEDCRVLSIFDLKQKGILKPDVVKSGSWIWSNAYTGAVRARVGYKLNTRSPFSFMHLTYTITRWHGRKDDMDYLVQLQTTPCHFGGERWWFVCPLTTNGRACKRRVGKLYLPTGGRYFGCRHCYDLTYKSSQESDKRVSFLKKLGPLAILRGIQDGEIDTLMGLKALPDDILRR
jgi:hypothetical protein